MEPASHWTSVVFETGIKNLSTERVSLYKEELAKQNPTHPFQQAKYDVNLRRHMMTIILDRPVCSGCSMKAVREEIHFHLCECKTEWYCSDYCKSMYTSNCSTRNEGKWLYPTHLCIHYKKWKVVTPLNLRYVV